jgi:hypothetical protein
VSHPTARVILDSISPAGRRITTLEVRMHRFVLAEFNTHRAFSRNSASSRAIPIANRIKEVREDPALPVRWGANGKGMQDHGDLGPVEAKRASVGWRYAAEFAVEHVQALSQCGLHKQWSNRLLEPFLWQTVIVTATDWRNFYAQRCHADAQPEMRAAAEAMRAAHLASEPVRRSLHLPYVEGYDCDDLDPYAAMKVSVARCARVSYLTHDGRRDIDADLALHERLRSARPVHLSPFEHVASARRDPDERLGNLRGWESERSFLERTNAIPAPALDFEVPWEMGEPAEDFR